MRSERYQKIIEENKRFEQESPYNFCDRWCERCPHHTQARCKLYQDEFEQKLTCIAHGRKPDDLEVIEQVMEWQYKEVDEKLQEHLEDMEEEIEFEDLPEDIQAHIKFVENNPLEATANQYHKKACLFIEQALVKEKNFPTEHKHDFDVVAWFHTLLPAKVHRALCGFHEPACEGEFAFYDAVAQFAICKRGIRESTEALRRLKASYPHLIGIIAELIAQLQNMLSRIEQMEESI